MDFNHKGRLLKNQGVLLGCKIHDPVTLTRNIAQE